MKERKTRERIVLYVPFFTDGTVKDHSLSGKTIKEDKGFRVLSVEMKDYFFIREAWTIHLLGRANVERYTEKDCPANTIKASSKENALGKVKKWIKDWIETWKFNAKDNGYKFLDFKTDYKTFAKCRIKTNEATDNFSLKVVGVTD
jgi:hypothetical protein